MDRGREKNIPAIGIVGMANAVCILSKAIRGLRVAGRHNTG